jgi:hypothetical protein
LAQKYFNRLKQTNLHYNHAAWQGQKGTGLAKSATLAQRGDTMITKAKAQEYLRDLKEDCLAVRSGGETWVDHLEGRDEGFKVMAENLAELQAFVADAPSPPTNPLEDIFSANKRRIFTRRLVLACEDVLRLCDKYEDRQTPTHGLRDAVRVILKQALRKKGE